MADTEIDPTISSWILDFLVRQPIEDQVLIPLARALPILDNNFLLKKLILFRKLESKVSNSTISEQLLEIMHQIDEMDQCLGSNDCSECLKKAFCAVAVECTVRCLRNSGNDVKGEYFDMVKRVWRGQVRAMERNRSRLVSEELLEWKGDIEAAVWEEEACLRVVERSGGVDAVEAVMCYLRAEKTRIGPSFLELVTEKIKAKGGVISGSICSGKRDDGDRCGRIEGQEPECVNNDKAKEGVISGSVCLRKGDDGDQCRRIEGQETECANNDKAKEGVISGSMCSRKRDDGDQCRRIEGQEPECANNDAGNTVVADTEKRNLLPRRKHIARKRSRGAKIANVDDSGAGPSCPSPLLGTPEVERVQDALESSRLELHAVVKDPLPEALCLAENVKSLSGAANLEPPEGQNRGASAVDTARNAQSGEANVGVENDNALGVQSGKQHAGRSRKINAAKSLMKRNNTARTLEWEDSIDCSPEEISDSTSRPHLPSPRVRRVSPLNIYKEPKLKKPRKHKRWSIAEEDALRAGVEKYGKGCWKLILNTYRDIFEERTEVDLKDKWRNLTRYH